MKRAPTAAEREHLARVAALPCIVCGACPAEVHHIRAGQGLGQRASHYDTIPLCFDHHSAQSRLPFGYAVHKGQRSFEARFGTERELLERTQLLLEG